jgi:lysophospholipase L1-like esterase
MTISGQDWRIAHLPSCRNSKRQYSNLPLARLHSLFSLCRVNAMIQLRIPLQIGAVKLRGDLRAMSPQTHFPMKAAVGLILSLAFRATHVSGQAANFERWEKEIAAFEEADRTTPPPKGGLLFIGSSTIRLWKTLAEDFPQHQVINRGFGGSQIADSTHFAERIIFPYAPRMILLRAGGNDLHAGKSPELVFSDFRAFVAKVQEKLPATEIAYIALSPTIARWSEKEKGEALNRMVLEYSSHIPGVKYINAESISLGPDGKPRSELFMADKLHLNLEGYKLLAASVRPYLPK